jgi:N-acetylmuramoyl-L-alanine amidase
LRAIKLARMTWTRANKLSIAHHRLMIADRPAPWRATPNIGGAIRPEIIVLHETASRLDAGGAIGWLCNPAAKASAHFVIDREGRATQLAVCNMQTWHAGLSSYKGREYVNRFSIGIALVGPGQRRAGTAGPARAWFGEEYPIDHYRLELVRTPEHGNGWWMPFTEEQLRMTAALCELLVDAYGLTDITTHWAVSPGRKVDPNPLFPLDWCRKLALGEDAPAMGLA